MNKISATKYISILFSILGIFLIFHIVIWTFFTSKIFGLPENYYVGDLSRITYKLDFLYKRKLEYTLPKQHINSTNYHKQHIDVITIGDSFSNADTQGKNPYYQDYLATKYNLNILNMHMIKGRNFLNSIIGLKNSGLLEKLHPKAIIIETIQRELINLYSAPLDLNFQPNIHNIQDILANRVSKSSIPKLPMINAINYKIPFYMLKYHFIKHHKLHKGYIFNLKQNMFTSKTKNQLLVYQRDINNLGEFTDKNIQQVNKKLNQVVSLLKDLNIKLFFMVPPDKYNLYYDYIKKRDYPKNQFFSIMSKLKKDYIFLDTNTILQNELKKGVQDLYYPDDTHWSYKASDAITNSKFFQNYFR